jgi:hypothetical protein
MAAPATTTRRRAAKATGKKRAARTTTRKAVAKKAMAAPVGAEAPMVVGLQATITISEHKVTLETQDIAKLAQGIQFQLPEPVQLGSLTDFLTWAKANVPGFPSDVNPSTWPEPFKGLAAMIVTVNEFCINNQVTPAQYTLGVRMLAQDSVKLPVIPVAIVGFGVRISKGDCSGSIKQLPAPR